MEEAKAADSAAAETVETAAAVAVDSVVDSAAAETALARLPTRRILFLL
jgi:hypothetical protein